MKTITSLFSVTALVVAVVLCCCTNQTAHAFTVKAEKAMPACHMHKQAKADAAPPATTDCACCTSKLLQADGIAKIVLVPPSFIPHVFIVVASLPINSFISVKYNLAYLDGPPGIDHDVPLYIKHHSLRI